MFRHGCEGMHGMARRTRFLFSVAMASPEAMRRNGGQFCARCWQPFGGMLGGAGDHYPMLAGVGGGLESLNMAQ